MQTLQQISAELPDPETHPELYKLVCDMMIHGQCGAQNPNASCMQNGKCSKHFPKLFCEQTTLNEDGYPKYHCLNDGRQHNVRGHMVDKQWVVPYSPLLLIVFICQINSGLTCNVRCIKYIHKYLYKGYDRTTIEFGHDKDEIKQYLDAHYVSAHEAYWRLLEREIHTQVPAVMALPVHGKDHQTVAFDPNTDEMTILDRAERAKTKLMAYFEANQTYPHAWGLLYGDCFM